MSGMVCLYLNMHDWSAWFVYESVTLSTSMGEQQVPVSHASMCNRCAAYEIRDTPIDYTVVNESE